MAKSGPGGGWSWNALEIQIQIQVQIPGSKYIEKLGHKYRNSQFNFLQKKHEVERGDVALFNYQHKFNCNTREQIRS